MYFTNCWSLRCWLCAARAILVVNVGVERPVNTAIGNGSIERGGVVAARPGARGATRKAVAERLAHIALLGAAAIFSLLAHGVD